MKDLAKLMKGLETEQKRLNELNNNDFSNFKIDVYVYPLDEKGKPMYNGTSPITVQSFNTLKEEIKAGLNSRLECEIKSSKRVIAERQEEYQELKEKLEKVRQEIEDLKLGA